MPAAMPRSVPNSAATSTISANTRDDLFPHLIGERFESLHNLANPPISLKLKSPYMSYIARDWPRATPVDSDGFEGAIGLAKGGLANAWGAGVYRFTERDLAGFPVTAAELRPFYDELTAHIGISGANDDLAPYFERDDAPAAAVAPLRFLRRHAPTLPAPSAPLFQRERVAFGRPRLAVLDPAAQRTRRLRIRQSRILPPARSRDLHAGLHC